MKHNKMILAAAAAVVLAVAIALRHLLLPQDACAWLDDNLFWAWLTPQNKIYKACYWQLRHGGVQDSDGSTNSFSATQADLLATLAVPQTQYETANYTSAVYKNYNNVCGMKVISSHETWQLSTTGGAASDGGTYGAYGSIEDSARDLALWMLRYYSDFNAVTDLNSYATALGNNGYYGETESAYAAGMATYYNNTNTA